MCWEDNGHIECFIEEKQESSDRLNLTLNAEILHNALLHTWASLTSIYINQRKCRLLKGKAARDVLHFISVLFFAAGLCLCTLLISGFLLSNLQHPQPHSWILRLCGLLCLQMCSLLRSSVSVLWLNMPLSSFSNSNWCCDPWRQRVTGTQTVGNEGDGRIWRR